MKTRIDYIPINNNTYRKINYKIAGILKEYSYKYKARTYTDFKRFKKDKDYNKRIKEYWNKFNINKIDYYSYYAYRYSSGVDSVKYIPEYMFYRYIEPKSSQLELARAYSDKNLYEKRFKDIVKMPKSIIRNMNGIFFDNNYKEISYQSAINILSSIDEKYIIKPSLYSGGGRNVSTIEKKENNLYLNDKIMTEKDIFEHYDRDYCIQEIIKQNSIISKINSDTVNTIKIFTGRVDDNIVFINAYARFGMRGYITDNYCSGGIYCGINKEGILSTLAHRRYGDGYKCHPDSGFIFKGFKYPGFKEIIEKAILVHKKLPYFRFATCDMTFGNENDPVLVEINLLHQDINGYQLQNGPLFGDYTDKILSDSFL